MQKVREAAARTKDYNNIKQLVLATHDFQDARQTLPPAWAHRGLKDKATNMNFIPMSAHVWVLPYIEQQNLWDDWTQDGMASINLEIPSYASDFEKGSILENRQNYAANFRLFGVSPGQGFDSTGFIDIVGVTAADLTVPYDAKAKIHNNRDGSSNTIYYATRYSECDTVTSNDYGKHPADPQGAFFGQKVATTSPSATFTAGNFPAFQIAPRLDQCKSAPATADLVQSFTSSGIQVGMGDGHVQSVGTSVSAQTWNAAMTVGDGTPLGSDWN